MKKLNTLGACILAIAFTNPIISQAAGYPVEFYAGLKIGIMDADISGFDDATNVGITIGYNYNENIAIEGEFTTSSSDGDVTISGVPGIWDVNTVAVYGVYRIGQKFYFKAKAGYLHEEVTIKVTGGGASGLSIEGTDSGFSAGLGGGWRVTDHAFIEAEYTLIESDVNYFSIGVNYSF